MSPVGYEVSAVRRENRSGDPSEPDQTFVAKCLGIDEIEVQALADYVNTSPGIYLEKRSGKTMKSRTAGRSSGGSTPRLELHRPGDDPPALALRGIALAQLGDLIRAKTTATARGTRLRPAGGVARARCVVAEAEIALVSRELGWPAKPLNSARTVLERHGDRANAAHARHLAIRRLLLIGRLDQAEHLFEDFNSAPLPPASRAAHELVAAGIAMRRLRIKAARAALARARGAARKAGILPLSSEAQLSVHTRRRRRRSQSLPRLLRSRSSDPSRRGRRECERAIRSSGRLPTSGNGMWSSARHDQVRNQWLALRSDRSAHRRHVSQRPSAVSALRRFL